MEGLIYFLFAYRTPVTNTHEDTWLYWISISIFNSSYRTIPYHTTPQASVSTEVKSYPSNGTSNASSKAPKPLDFKTYTRRKMSSMRFFKRLLWTVWGTGRTWGWPWRGGRSVRVLWILFLMFMAPRWLCWRSGSRLKGRYVCNACVYVYVHMYMCCC